MVFVDHHAVETRLGAVLKLVEVHAVQFGGLFRAEVFVGEHQVGVAVLGGNFLGIPSVSHLGEEKYFVDHINPPRRYGWFGVWSSSTNASRRHEVSACCTLTGSYGVDKLTPNAEI